MESALRGQAEMNRTDHIAAARATLVAALLLGGLAGCGSAATPVTETPSPTPAGEALASVALRPDEIQLTCGGPRTFPVASLDAPTGAEREQGPEYDALREAITRFGPGGLTWRMVARDEDGAMFLARVEGGIEVPPWAQLEMERVDEAWRSGGGGLCALFAVLAPEFGAATWKLDPALPLPTADTTELHLLVWELTCSSGSPATGRMSAAHVAYATDAVTIAIGVRPKDGVQTCQGNPGAPVTITLDEPLGNRTLLDGGRFPPAPPTDLSSSGDPSGSPRACMSARIEGVLVLVRPMDMQLRDASGATRRVVWPDGYSARPGEPAALLDELGAPVGNEGDLVAIGGGEIDADGTWLACGAPTLLPLGP